MHSGHYIGQMTKIGGLRAENAALRRDNDRMKDGIRAVVAALVNENSANALELARVVMYGGDVNNPLDFARLAKDRSNG